jgi:hypothetical protein
MPKKWTTPQTRRLRRSRRLRRAKQTVLTLGIALAALCIPAQVRYTGPYWLVRVGAGEIVVEGAHLSGQRGWEATFNWPNIRDQIDALLPTFYLTRVPKLIELPLWGPLALCLLAYLLLVWYSHRTTPTGKCRNCGYDLQGNRSGRCPECGTVCAIRPLRRD